MSSRVYIWLAFFSSVLPITAAGRIREPMILGETGFSEHGNGSWSSADSFGKGFNVKDERFVVNPRKYGLPLFGRTFNGRERSVIERWYGYSNAMIVKNPVRKVSKADIAAWRKKIHVRRYKTLEQSGRSKFVEMKKRVSDMVDVTVGICAECYQYNLKTESATCIKVLAELYSDKNYYRWESVSYGKQGAEAWFNSRLANLEEILHSRLDQLDTVHRREFEDWKLANSAAYSDILKRIKDDEIQFNNDVVVKRVERKANAAMRRAQQAEERAAAAEERAAEAQRRADEAEQNAAEADQRASDAEMRVNFGW